MPGEPGGPSPNPAEGMMFHPDMNGALAVADADRINNADRPVIDVQEVHQDLLDIRSANGHDGPDAQAEVHARLGDSVSDLEQKVVGHGHAVQEANEANSPTGISVEERNKLITNAQQEISQNEAGTEPLLRGDSLPGAKPHRELLALDRQLQAEQVEADHQDIAARAATVLRERQANKAEPQGADQPGLTADDLDENDPDLADVKRNGMTTTSAAITPGQRLAQDQVKGWLNNADQNHQAKQAAANEAEPQEPGPYDDMYALADKSHQSRWQKWRNKRAERAAAKAAQEEEATRQEPTVVEQEPIVEDSTPGPYDDIYELMDRNQMSKRQRARVDRAQPKAESGVGASGDADEDTMNVDEAAAMFEDEPIGNWALRVEEEPHAYDDINALRDHTIDNSTRLKRLRNRLGKVRELAGDATRWLSSNVAWAGEKGWDAANRFLNHPEKGRRNRRVVMGVGVAALGLAVGVIAYKSKEMADNFSGLTEKPRTPKDQFVEMFNQKYTTPEARKEAIKQFNEFFDWRQNFKNSNPVYEGVNFKTDPVRYNQLMDKAFSDGLEYVQRLEEAK